MLRTYFFASIASLGLLVPQASRACHIESFTGSEASGMASAHMVVEPHEVGLIDTLLSQSDATKLADAVAKTGKPLKFIFITHAHPDHFLGLEVLHKRFPNTKIWSTAAVVGEIKKNGPGFLAHYKKVLGKDAPSNLFVPEVIPGKSIRIEGVDLQVIEFTGGESSNSAGLYLAAVKGFFTGDVVYSQTHLWLKEKGIDAWLKNLETVQKYPNVKAIYPGHGPNGDLALVASTRSYLMDFQTAVGMKNQKTALKFMEERYPKFQMTAFLAKQSLPAYLPQSRAASKPVQ